MISADLLSVLMQGIQARRLDWGAGAAEPMQPPGDEAFALDTEGEAAGARPGAPGQTEARRAASVDPEPLPAERTGGDVPANAAETSEAVAAGREETHPAGTEAEAGSCEAALPSPCFYPQGHAALEPTRDDSALEPTRGDTALEPTRGDPAPGRLQDSSALASMPGAEAAPEFPEPVEAIEPPAARADAGAGAIESGPSGSALPPSLEPPTGSSGALVTDAAMPGEELAPDLVGEAARGGKKSASGSATSAQGTPPPAGPAPVRAPGAMAVAPGEADLGWRLSADPASASGVAAPARDASGAPSGAPAGPPSAAAGQVAMAIRSSEADKIEIRLDPPELGRVQIEMRVVEGALHALVVAERAEAGDLLRRYAEILQRDLEAAGYGNVSLEFAAGREEGSERRPEPGRFAGPLEGLAAAPVTAQPVRAVTDGRLDIRL